MPWQGIWFDPEAFDGKSRSPEWFEGLVPPQVYPYPHNFAEAEEKRLAGGDPSTVYRDGEPFRVFYALSHDGSSTALGEQGCSLLSWLFGHFAKETERGLSARFSEIPVVIHEPHPVKAAALANALALMRFLDAGEDQAIAKLLILPWKPLRLGPRVTAQDFEKQVIDFLHGETFYPEDVTLFDILERRDLKSHRALGPCCETQIGFIRSILEWIDECWPQSEREGRELSQQLRNSLADEARVWRTERLLRAAQKLP